MEFLIGMKQFKPVFQAAFWVTRYRVMLHCVGLQPESSKTNSNMYEWFNRSLNWENAGSLVRRVGEVAFESEKKPAFLPGLGSHHII